MIDKRGFLLVISIVFILLSLGFVSAFEFNGTVYDVDGNALNNSVINITVRSITNFGVVGYNFTTSNATGWFNITVAENANWMYEPKITNSHPTLGYVQFIGQSLPAFPAFVFNNLGSTSFYLHQAGTINISAINSTGSRISFRYQVKDQKLGYSVAEDLVNSASEVNIKLPRNRNYSLMVYPSASMPVSFNWNNFSSGASYTLNVTHQNNQSNYNGTTRTLNYQFNTTLKLVRVSGFTDANLGWNEYTVVPYLLEPSNMVHSDFGDMPYNLSAFAGATDFHTFATGFYNISLPATAETSNILLFATSRNGSSFYGGFRNISLSYSSAAGETIAFNFTTVRKLLGTWANISMDTTTGGSINISTAKQTFNLVNVTNSTLTQVTGHIETTIDYSTSGALEFTWMADISQSASASFSIPLLNNTNIKEMNIFIAGGSSGMAPRRVAPTVASIISDNNANANASNITIYTFNPQAIDSTLAAADITMRLYISNSSCDIPSPPSVCTIGSSTSMSTFNPFSAIIGGGKLSFRMGTGNIFVHYVNVDMLASGPPDALFDNSNTNKGSSSAFDQAVRFGSGGPTVYDYVLVSIPYTETAGSGLNETAEVNMTLPLLYDESWKVIWNTSSNGSNAGALAGNFSHYSTFSSDWSQLMNQTSCTKTNVTISSQINSSKPCFIDTATNRVWIRLPHFSGNAPSVTGSVVPAAAGGTTGGTTGGSGAGADNKNVKTKSQTWTKITPGNVTIMKINDKEIGIKEISIEVNNPAQNVKITVTKYAGKPAEVSVEKSGKVYKYLNITARNLKSELKKAVISIQIEKSWLVNNSLIKEKIALFKYNESSQDWKELETRHVDSDSENEYFEVELDSFSFFAIAEKVEVAEEVETPEGVEEGEEESGVKEIGVEQQLIGKGWVILIAILVVIVLVVGCYWFVRNKKNRL